MSRLLKSVIALPTFLQFKRAYIVVILGQSNAAGNIDNPNIMIPAWRGPQSQILTANYGELGGTAPFSFLPLEAGVNAATCFFNTPFGQEQAIMHDLLDYVGEPVFLLKLAYGGYFIENFMTGGNLHPFLLSLIPDAIEALRAEGYNDFKFLPVQWIQGESNAGANDSSAAYSTKLASVISDLRGSSPYAANLRIEAQYLSDKQTTYSSLQRANINGGFDLRKAADPLVDTFDPDLYDPAMQPGEETIHYSFAGHTTLGHAKFQGWLDNGYL